MGLIFYDTETTGIDPFFDQILQFAAIKTDEDFNEIDRCNFRCRLSPHIIPHPKAMLVTGITADMLTDPKLPSHYEMMTAIRTKLESWGPGVFVGYNSLKFDEAMLRSAFYQTLQPIYLTNTNGNGRTDAMRLAQAAFLFAPETICIPRDNGKPILRLDRLAPENGFTHANAHDALADVEATIFMTKKIATAAPDLWRRLRAAADKRTVKSFIESAEPFLLTDFYFNKGHSWPVVWFGDHPENSSLSYAAVLDDKFDDIAKMAPDELERALVSTPRPIRRIKTNAAPLMTSFDKLTAYPQFKSLDIEAARQRAEVLRNDAALRTRLITAMLSIDGAYEDDLDAEVEERIYEGFYSRRDEQRITEFHAASWPQRSPIADAFDDERLQTLAKRLIYAADPVHLQKSDRSALEQAIADRYQTEEVKPSWLTPKAALKALTELWDDATPSEQAILTGLRTLYQDRDRHFGVPL